MSTVSTSGELSSTCVCRRLLRHYSLASGPPYFFLRVVRAVLFVVFGIPVLLCQACGSSFLRIITRRMAEAFVLVGERIMAKTFLSQVLEPMSNRSPPQSLTKQGGLAGRV